MLLHLRVELQMVLLALLLQVEMVLINIAGHHREEQMQMQVISMQEIIS